jgi:hypothetical protein
LANFDPLPVKKMKKSAPITVVQFSVVQKSAAGFSAAGKLDRKRFMYPKESSDGKGSVSFGQVRSPKNIILLEALSSNFSSNDNGEPQRQILFLFLVT